MQIKPRVGDDDNNVNQKVINRTRGENIQYQGPMRGRGIDPPHGRES